MSFYMIWDIEEVRSIMKDFYLFFAKKTDLRFPKVSCSVLPIADSALSVTESLELVNKAILIQVPFGNYSLPMFIPTPLCTETALY